MGSHFKKLSMDEAEESFTLISETLRKSLKGGCNDCKLAESAGIPTYSSSEYDSLIINGAWRGGYVCGRGFMSAEGSEPYGEYGQYAGYDKYCSKHKVIYFGSSCFMCDQDFNNSYGGSENPGSGSSNYGDPYDPYAGNYGGYPNIPGVTRLPDIDFTFTPYYQSQVNGDSLQACQSMLSKYNASHGDQYHVYQLKKEVKGVLTDYGSDPSTNFRNAIDCINRHVSAGKPLIVGINHTLNYGQNEGTTDQFVIITGRGFDTEKNMYYFIYVDPSRSNVSEGCDSVNNRFYCDAAAKQLYDDTTYMGKRFDVTQIRPNDGKKPEELINSTII